MIRNVDVMEEKMDLVTNFYFYFLSRWTMVRMLQKEIQSLYNFP
jgi:hypothetical protein